MCRDSSELQSSFRAEPCRRSRQRPGWRRDVARPMTLVLWARSRANLGGAVVSQFSQAAASLLLTVAGVRALSISTFGVLSFLLGTLVFATAIMTGFVGDSLTVLDRHDRSVRAGLQAWSTIIACGLLVAGASLSYVTGLLEPADALLYGLALVAFTVEDTARRLLMATLRFWSVVVTDMCYLFAALAVLLAARATSGGLALHNFLWALVVGQVLATLVAVSLAPKSERWLAPWRNPAIRHVAAFGGWRALQQCLRPGALTVVRLMVIGAVSTAALGDLEAARVYMSPALLVANGVGGYLLATYSRQRHLSRRQSLRVANIAAASLTTTTVLLCALSILLIPYLGPLMTGGSTQISVVAVISWALLSASIALGMPYASLGAVRGRPSLVVGLRIVDTALSVTFVAVLLYVVEGAAALVPAAMAVAGFIGAGLLRWVGLASNRWLPERASVAQA
jgi:O-antigen/teichoic acid export membrane protein